MGTAIFYDTQNVALREAGLDDIMSQILDSPLAGKVLLQRAYAVKGQIKPELSALLEKRGIQVTEIVLTLQNGKHKPNQVDLKMCADIPGLVLRRPSVSTVVLVTGDGDFRFLLETLKEHGKRVILVSAGMVNTAQSLLPLCDDWIDLSRAIFSDNLIMEIWRTRMDGQQYLGTDYLIALRQFLEDSAKDALLLRILRSGSLTIGVLRAIINKFRLPPSHQGLGFANWSELVKHAVRGTRFRLVLNEQKQQLAVYVSEEPDPGETYRPVQMYRGIIGIDKGYKSGRMRQWLKYLSGYSSNQLRELMFYVEFLNNNHLIRYDINKNPVLPKFEDLPVLLAEQLRKRLIAYCCPADEDSIAELFEELNRIETPAVRSEADQLTKVDNAMSNTIDYRELFDTFAKSADPETAAQMSSYMRGQFPYLGIKTPKRRELSKKFLTSAKKADVVDWKLVEEAWDKSEREYQYIALDYLNAKKSNLTPEDVPSLKQLAVTKSWWDTIDSLDRIVGDIALRHPKVNKTLLAWSKDKNIWLRRIAIDHQLLRKEKTDAELLTKIIDNNLGQEEFFINKAIGWSLREYSKTNPEWVRDFIESRRDRLSPLSVREASKYISFS